MQPTQTRRHGFTLIELLIVVAIIAILAAIAVPNFLEAQVRSKTSRAKADMRSLATAIEAYRVDFNAYPKGNQNNVSRALAGDPATHVVLERLSTPIAFITSALLPDPFPAQFRTGVINPTTGVAQYSAPPDSPGRRLTAVELQQEGIYKYAALSQQPSANVLALVANPTDKATTAWFLWSPGPDSVKVQIAGSGLLSSMPVAAESAVIQWIYDPTNGTISNGDIYRIGGMNPGGTAPGGTFYSVIVRHQ